MRAYLRNPKDFWTGVLFIGFGIAFMLVAQDYPMGSARRMGPAYFPVILGGVLALIGVATAGRGLVTRGTPVGVFALKKAALVTCATVAFAMLVRDAGLVVSVILLTLMGASASAHFRWRSGLMLAISLAVFCVLVFVKGLGLALPVMGPLFGG